MQSASAGDSLPTSTAASRVRSGQLEAGCHCRRAATAARVGGGGEVRRRAAVQVPDHRELPPAAAAEALVEPARAEHVAIDPAAVELIVDYTEGYPYFIQEFGRAVRDVAAGSRITAEDAAQAHEVVEAVLHESFFRAWVQRSSPEELRYMRAMADLGPQVQRAADVAEVLARSSAQVAPLRARLINKGPLYTPRYGYAKFTVPQFDRFMRRHMSLDTIPPA